MDSGMFSRHCAIKGCQAAMQRCQRRCWRTCNTRSVTMYAIRASESIPTAAALISASNRIGSEGASKSNARTVARIEITLLVPMHVIGEGPVAAQPVAAIERDILHVSGDDAGGWTQVFHFSSGRVRQGKVAEVGVVVTEGEAVCGRCSRAFGLALVQGVGRAVLREISFQCEGAEIRCLGLVCAMTI